MKAMEKRGRFNNCVARELREEQEMCRASGSRKALLNERLLG